MLAEIGYLAESQPDPASVQPDPAERQPVQQQPILTAIALVDAAPCAPVSAVAVHNNPAPGVSGRIVSAGPALLIGAADCAGIGAGAGARGCRSGRRPDRLHDFRAVVSVWPTDVVRSVPVHPIRLDVGTRWRPSFFPPAHPTQRTLSGAPPVQGKPSTGCRQVEWDACWSGACNVQSVGLLVLVCCHVVARWLQYWEGWGPIWLCRLIQG